MQLLHAVLTRRRPLDEALDDVGDADRLAPRDRAFARLLVATVLRRLGQIDAVLEGFIARPLPNKAAAVRDLLRLSVAQLLFLGTPPYAAVSTAVETAQTLGHGHYKALLNAVLRRVGADGSALLAAQDAARLNTPDWLWRSWAGAFGEVSARAVAAAHLADPPLDLAVRRDPGTWADRLGGIVLPNGSVRLHQAGPVADLPGYDEAAWWVQDAAATLPVRLLGPLAGRRVADLCAAPGGKTAQLAAAGAQVTAVDLSDRRLGRLAENLDRLGLSAALVAADAADWTPGHAFDAVLLDAPCTATGTIRRHPDILRLKRPNEGAEMAALQARLLENAGRLVMPGGLLVYATCSLQPDEGGAQIDRWLADGAPFERLPVSADELPGLAEAVTGCGDVRTLPCHWPDSGGLDGFYIARLRRH